MDSLARRFNRMHKKEVSKKNKRFLKNKNNVTVSQTTPTDDFGKDYTPDLSYETSEMFWGAISDQSHILGEQARLEFLAMSVPVRQKKRLPVFVSLVDTDSE